jgi:UDPglucose 6-dehydrogenase
VHAADKIGFNAELVRAVEAVNNRQKEVVFAKLLTHFNGDLKGKTIALWGLAFKPNTDDMREAPSRDFMEAAWAAGANIQAYDPVAADEAKRIYGDRADLLLCDSAQSTLKSADALVVVTEWREFRSPDFESIKNALTNPVVIDGRNIYDPLQMHDLGFTYYSIGRGV